MARLQEMTMNRGNRALVFLALAAGLVAAVLVFVALNEGDDGKTATVSEGVPVASVVVASQNISAGAEITAEMVRVVEVPTDFVVAGALGDSALVVGDVARVAIAEGEQIIPNKLGLAVEDGLSGVVPAGMRGVAVRVDEVTAVGGLLLPGNFVDIIATYRIDRPELGDGAYILRTETILQNVEVLSIAQEAQKPTARVATAEDAEVQDPRYTSGDPDDPEEQPKAASLTVAVDPAQAQVLTLKQQHAERVWAVLRQFGDNQIVEIQPTDVLIIESGDGGVYDAWIP